MHKRQRTSAGGQGTECQVTTGRRKTLESRTLGVGLFFCGKADRFGRPGRQFCLLDAAEEDIAEAIGGFIVETEVRIFFHDIKCVAEFIGEFRLRCADRHDFILPGRSFGFLRPLFHRRVQTE